MNSVEKIFEQAHGVENNFINMVAKLEERLANVDVEIKEKGQSEFREIISAFNELKEALALRFEMVAKVGNEKQIPQAMEEISKLFEVMFDVLEDDLENYSVSNKTSEGQEGIVATTLSRENEDGSLNELTFNFVATEKSQARAKINWYENVEDKDNSKQYSLRIDRDEERKQVAIDVDTPTINKIFRGISDENGNGHHFKSESLQGFVESENFSHLVEVFKDVITQTDEHFTLQDLMEKYNN